MMRNGAKECDGAQRDGGVFQDEGAVPSEEPVLPLPSGML